MNEWVQNILIQTQPDTRSIFEWKNPTPGKKARPYGSEGETTRYFEPSTKIFMLNYRVADPGGPGGGIKRREGVTIVDNIETYDCNW